LCLLFVVVRGVNISKKRFLLCSNNNVVGEKLRLLVKGGDKTAVTYLVYYVDASVVARLEVSLMN